MGEQECEKLCCQGGELLERTEEALKTRSTTNSIVCLSGCLAANALLKCVGFSRVSFCVSRGKAGGRAKQSKWCCFCAADTFKEHSVFTSVPLSSNTPWSSNKSP